MKQKKEKYITTLKQHKGTRATQQDTAGYKAYQDGANVAHIFIVADGVGSVDRGANSSAFVVQSLLLWFEKKKDKLFITEAKEIVKELKEEINGVDDLLKKRSREDGLSYGTALTLVLVVNSKCIVLQVGDGRAYMYSQASGLTQLEKDQTKYQLMLDSGIPVPKEKEKEYKATITQCIGNKMQPKPKETIRVLPAEYSLLICTDGFYQKINKEDINNIFRSKLSDEEILLKTIEHILKEGESDNITALLHRKEFF